MMITTIGVLALIFLIWNIATSISIVNSLKASSVKADYRWLRFKAYGYAKKYKDLTLEKEGKAGNLYYHFTISMFLFISALVIGIILAYVGKH
jgi:hypothetical protein